ncbi:hypothetical protein CC78DRAFT_82737 [Lojkania enalia]|uniref:Uncharacterized protein n=1 Tax=Lojkania enalia TaxID=147567 RepID=A0A9P4MVL0_9PLEO|nr:hypothetical protein CC78DRAFT_82737 [Didymosphaeria enalia]
MTEFDEAILSRIHLMPRYDELSSDARKQIWDHFLSRSHTANGAPNIRDEEFERLVSSKLNGPQVAFLDFVWGVSICKPRTARIKDVVSTAHALATKEMSGIKFTRLFQGCEGEREVYP